MPSTSDPLTPCVDQAEFRSVPGRSGVELYRAHIVQNAFEPHTHQAYGLGVIESGVERFRYGGTDHLATPQSIVMMQPDMLHTGRAETASGWRYRMLYIDATMVSELSGETHWSFDEVVETNRHELAQRLVLLHHRLWLCGDQLEADGLLLEFMTSLRPLAHTGSRGLRDGASTRFDPVVEYMRASLQERILLADLAAVAGLSPLSLSAQVQGPVPHYPASNADGVAPVLGQADVVPAHASRGGGCGDGVDRSGPSDPCVRAPLWCHPGSLSAASEPIPH